MDTKKLIELGRQCEELRDLQSKIKNRLIRTITVYDVNSLSITLSESTTAGIKNSLYTLVSERIEKLEEEIKDITKVS